MAWLAKCVAFELRAMNCIVILLGFAMQGLGLILLIADPLTETEGFTNVVDTYKIKVAPFALGMALMLAGFIGMRFVKTRSFGAACPYFTFLIIFLVVEIILLVFTLRMVNTLQIAGTPEKAKLAGDAERYSLSKAFFSFQKRFAFDVTKTQDFQNHDRNCHFDPPLLVPEGGFKKCHDVAVKCKQGNEKYENMMKKWCVEKNDAGKKQYMEDCDKCLHDENGASYYTIWIKDSKRSADLVPKEINGTASDLVLWNSETSLGFCRCYGRIINSMSRHVSTVTYGIIAFICLQLCLIGCSGYLLLCTTKQDAGDDDSDYGAELM